MPRTAARRLPQVLPSPRPRARRRPWSPTIAFRRPPVLQLQRALSGAHRQRHGGVSRPAERSQISCREYETTIARDAAPRLPRGAITQTDGLARASTQIPRGFLRGKNLESKVMPAVGGKCDRPYGAHPLHGLLNGAAFAVHEIVSHKKPGSVLACRAMNEYWNLPADVLLGKSKRCREYAETMLEIAAARRCITRKRNARVAQPAPRKIFRTAKLAVVDRQHRANTRPTQIVETPRFRVGTAPSGEQVRQEPEYVVHVKAANERS